MSVFSRRASVALLALALVGCGDSTAPVTLTDEQVDDLMDAMSSVNFLGLMPAPGSGGNLAVVTIDETVECPNGGSLSVNLTADENEETGTSTIQFTQGFSGCMATSSQGRVWTFDGDPNIVTSLTGTFNETTEAFTITGTQTGGVKFASDLGSGRCALSVTVTMSGDADSFEGSVTGTVCGRTVDRSISVVE